MKIKISPKAEKQLKKLSKVNQIVVVRKIRLLPDYTQANNNNIKKLVGFKDIYRFRIGDMRVVFKNLKATIYIVSIGHRKDVYKLLT